MKAIDVVSTPQKIVIGVPYYGGQRPDWWTQVASEIVRMPMYKDLVYEGGEKGPNLEYYATVALRGVAVQNQRNGICDWFLRSEADWLWFIDDDTIPPKGILGNLFRAKHVLVSGLYWGGDPRKRTDDFEPFPLVYRRLKNGMYQSMKDWEGSTPAKIHQLIENKAVVEADAAGAGNLLIHRKVLEDIKKTHTVIRLQDSGGLKLIANKHIRGKLPTKPHNKKRFEVRNGVLTQRVYAPETIEEGEGFYPFFIQEHGRTEDLAFFEAAKAAGHRLLVDLGVESEHLKVTSISSKDFHLDQKFDVLK